MGQTTGQDETKAERAFLRRLQAGDPEAFARLLDGQSRRVYNVALRLLGDPAEAEDATQEAFLAVYRALPGFRGGARLETWVYRIAVDVCLQRRRKAASVSAGAAESTAGRREHDPFQAAARGEARAMLAEALRALPEAQRDVVVLHGLEGLTYAEVAAALGCPVGTVKSRLSTAFGRLRQALGPYVLAGGGGTEP